MNMGANLGGAISPTLTPWLAQRWGWGASLGLAAFISFLGGIMWLRIRPGDGLAKDGAEC
ncbi:MAG TPA: MFS transporter [Nitrospira sp.]|nr:MFS transporter [Nitrospira sp.]